ncbi:hypothetical protein AND_004385 [Anopheles darlingi]|uniref:Uncharacterized protein n=1 Tax=Anopheles darlingi TaxID=43151 RepID=W5JKP8_ANODA|nr:hypothetical protein AND_004385 [Anopheles darlingi]
MSMLPAVVVVVVVSVGRWPSRRTLTMPSVDSGLATWSRKEYSMVTATTVEQPHRPELFRWREGAKQLLLAVNNTSRGTTANRAHYTKEEKRCTAFPLVRAGNGVCGTEGGRCQPYLATDTLLKVKLFYTQNNFHPLPQDWNVLQRRRTAGGV